MLSSNGQVASASARVVAHARSAVLDAIGEPTAVRRAVASAALVGLEKAEPGVEAARALVLGAGFQQQMGAHGAGLSLALAALRATCAPDDRATRRQALSLAGCMLADSGAIADGLQYAVAGLDAAIELADADATSDAWNALASTLLAAGHPLSALVAAGHALTLARLSERPAHATRAMCHSALASLYLDDLNSALKMARQCVDRLGVPRVLEDDVLGAMAEHHYSRALARSGRVDMARQRAELALRHATSCGSSLALAYAAVSHAMCDAAEGAHKPALAQLERALSQRVPQVVLPALHALVEATRRMGDRALMIAARERLYVETRRRQQSAVRLQTDLARHAVAPTPAQRAFGITRGLDPRAGALGPPSDPLDRLEGAVYALEGREHAAGVARLYRCGQVAARIAHDLGWPRVQVDKIERAARLHAIGKLYVPPEIMCKRGVLTTGERSLVQRCYSLGAELLRAAGLREERILWDVVEAASARWDGAGPCRRKGDGIPMAARIVAVAAAYVSLTGARPYRLALAGESAVYLLRRASGHRFDPDLVERAIRLSQTHAGLEPDEPPDNRYLHVRQRLQQLLGPEER